jgi:flagellar hook protein FlgE
MSIGGILSSAVSGLQAGATRVAAAADNVANVQTAGYKSVEVHGRTLVTGQTSTAAYSAGGVQALPRQTVSVQGLLQGTQSVLDLGIAGAGFFVVAGPGATDALGDISYTRAGSFRPDKDGFLANAAGFRLLAHPTDAAGVAVGGLQAVDLDRLAGTAEATTQVRLGANLPAGAAVGVSERAGALVHDSLGTGINVSLVFTKVDTNRFTLTIADPQVAAGGGVAGTAARADGGPYAIDVFFNGDGTLAGFDLDGDGVADSAAPPGLAVGGLTTGGDDLAISLDLGQAGGGDGLTQYAGPFSVVSVDADGARFGTVAAISVSGDGTIVATYDNGTSRPVYKIPLATFGNPDGLESVSGNAYLETAASGIAVVGDAGSAGAGTVEAAALEASTVDLGEQFAQMILAGHAYAAGIATLQAADRMTRELVDIKT